MKRFTSFALILCLVLSLFAFGTVSAADEKYKGQGKSLTELSAAWETVTDLEVADFFTTTPNFTTAPYAAGVLSNASQKYATAYLNFARYLAGVPAVSLNTTYSSLAAAAAVVNRANGSTSLSHSPAQPAGMSTALYDTGFTGAAKCNLSYGRLTLYDSIGKGWLNDSDASNIGKLGHRVNFLSPTLPGAGWGKADTHYAGMALGGTSNGGAAFGLTNDYMWDLNDWRGIIQYPAPGYFPIQALPNNGSVGPAWSIQFDRTYSMNNSNFTVTVNNRTQGVTTNLTEADTNVSGKYLSKPNADIAPGSASSSLGMISFRVSSAPLVVGDEYTITVSGIKNNSNASLPNIVYDVQIVDMNNLPGGGTVVEDIEITSASMVVTPPAHGANPDFTVTVTPADIDKYTAKVQWFSEEDNHYMIATDTFVEGQLYYSDIKITPKSGYKISDYESLPVTINGESAERFDEGWSAPDINYYISFIATGDIEITSASVTVTPPVDGRNPDFTVIVDPEDADKYTAEVKWFSGGELMTSSDVFTEGSMYVADIKITPKSGYKISDYESLPVTVNGESADWCIAGHSPDDSYYVFFTATENPLLLGDVNQDDLITAADALLTLQIIAGHKSATTIQLLVARVEANDTAPPTAADALLILRKALGLIEFFPCEMI